MFAFDADVLIYAAAPDHPLGRRVLNIFVSASPSAPVGVGSVMLIPEILTKPLRSATESNEQSQLERLLARLDLRSCDEATAYLALALAAKHGLKATDAVHLATAVRAGADFFLTNNRHDFPRLIAEVSIIYPDDLPPANPPKGE